MNKSPIVRSESSTSWKTQLKRFLCVLLKGHKFLPNLGKRSDKRCLRCGVIFYTKTPYKKGKNR